nr:MAG TPA: hypothetical protein [Caudoviricetes sp.]
MGLPWLISCVTGNANKKAPSMRQVLPQRGEGWGLCLYSLSKSCSVIVEGAVLVLIGDCDLEGNLNRRNIRAREWRDIQRCLCVLSNESSLLTSLTCLEVISTSADILNRNVQNVLIACKNLLDSTRTHCVNLKAECVGLAQVVLRLGLTVDIGWLVRLSFTLWVCLSGLGNTDEVRLSWELNPVLNLIDRDRRALCLCWLYDSW